MSDLDFIGINAATGDYLLLPDSAQVFGQVARREQPDESHLRIQQMVRLSDIR